MPLTSKQLAELRTGLTDAKNGDDTRGIKKALEAGNLTQGITTKAINDALILAAKAVDEHGHHVVKPQTLVAALVGDKSSAVIDQFYENLYEQFVGPAHPDAPRRRLSAAYSPESDIWKTRLRFVTPVQAEAMSPQAAAKLIALDSKIRSLGADFDPESERGYPFFFYAGKYADGDTVWENPDEEDHNKRRPVLQLTSPHHPRGEGEREFIPDYQPQAGLLWQRLLKAGFKNEDMMSWNLGVALTLDDNVRETLEKKVGPTTPLAYFLAHASDKTKAEYEHAGKENGGEERQKAIVATWIETKGVTFDGGRRRRRTRRGRKGRRTTRKY